MRPMRPSQELTSSALLRAINTTLARNRRFHTDYLFVLIQGDRCVTGYLEHIAQCGGAYCVTLLSNGTRSTLTFSTFHDFFLQIEKQFSYYQRQEQCIALK